VCHGSLVGGATGGQQYLLTIVNISILR
jgi:hypothetical protein